jgi:hypothetical protein
MSKQYPFKWRYFEAEIIVLCVRWYVRVRHVTDFSILPQAERTGRRFFGARASPLAERSREQQHASKARSGQSVVAAVYGFGSPAPSGVVVIVPTPPVCFQGK